MTLHKALTANAALAALPRDDFEALVGAMIEGAHGEGHTYFREGQRGDAVYLVLEGEVRLHRHGGEQEVTRVGPGAWFGILAMVDGTTRSNTAEGVGRTRVAEIPVSAFALLYASYEHLSLAMQDTLAAQLAHDLRAATARLAAALG